MQDVDPEVARQRARDTKTVRQWWAVYVAAALTVACWITVGVGVAPASIGALGAFTTVNAVVGYIRLRRARARLGSGMRW